MSDAYQCPICGSAAIDMFFEWNDVPVHCNVLWETREQAQKAPRGDIELGFCRSCGHIYNFKFDPERLEYSQKYENSLYHSPRFRQYARDLVDYLTDKFSLNDKHIIEIGCGKGDFLYQICRKGANRGTGFDPSYEPDRAGYEKLDYLTFIVDFYSEKYASLPADLICCRHVLEHMRSPVEFLRSVKNNVNAQAHAAVFFEVPNVLFTLDDLAIWDIIYEHCSYFSPMSLFYLFEMLGFDVLGLRETFGGQFLTIEAISSGHESEEPLVFRYPLTEMQEKVRQFEQRFEEKVAAWDRIFTDRLAAMERGVVWGAGSKGVSFLNFFGEKAGIDYVVDVNPNKHDKYVPASGQKIVPPEFLAEYKPEYVIIMNPLYAEEIREQLNRIGVEAVTIVDDAWIHLTEELILP